MSTVDVVSMAKIELRGVTVNARPLQVVRQPEFNLSHQKQQLCHRDTCRPNLLNYRSLIIPIIVPSILVGRLRHMPIRRSVPYPNLAWRGLDLPYLIAPVIIPTLIPSLGHFNINSGGGICLCPAHLKLLVWNSINMPFTLPKLATGPHHSNHKNCGKKEVDSMNGQDVRQVRKILIEIASWCGLFQSNYTIPTSSIQHN